MTKVIQCTIPGPMGLESFNMKFKTKREAILVEQGRQSAQIKKFLQWRGGIRSSAPTRSLKNFANVGPAWWLRPLLMGRNLQPMFSEERLETESPFNWELCILLLDNIPLSVRAQSNFCHLANGIKIAMKCSHRKWVPKIYRAVS